MTSSPDLLAALAQTCCTAWLSVIDRPLLLRLTAEQSLLQVSDPSPGVLQLPLQDLLALSRAFPLNSQPFAVLAFNSREPINGSLM